MPDDGGEMADDRFCHRPSPLLLLLLLALLVAVGGAGALEGQPAVGVGAALALPLGLGAVARPLGLELILAGLGPGDLGAEVVPVGGHPVGRLDGDGDGDHLLGAAAPEAAVGGDVGVVAAD